MRNVPAMTAREIRSAFLSPLAYAVLTIFLFFSGFFFFVTTTDAMTATLDGYIDSLVGLILVATPLLTMRLLSEEYRSGTIETLRTAPVTDTDVILGKYFGALAFFLFMLAPTGIYVLVLCAMGEPHLGPILASYLGVVLMGAQFLALGLFCSALTSSQLVAGMLALVLLLTIWVLGAIGEWMVGPFAPVMRYIGTVEHVLSFTKGRIAVRDIFYFLSLTVFWLFLAVRALESKRWR